jgi:endonuclease G, mitochondrial
MNSIALKNFQHSVKSSEKMRAERRALVRTGRWRDVEPSVERAKANAARESIQGATLDYQPTAFLSKGVSASKAVAYIEATNGAKTSFGTGFLISPSLFITNQHVLETAAFAQGASITFNREQDEHEGPQPITSFRLDPERCFVSSKEEELDFAVVFVGSRLSGDADLGDFGYLPLSNAPDKHQLGMNANVIQHPRGGPKKIAIRNNTLLDRDETKLLYETDTEPGSSGAPVLNDDWEVVALHHYGEPMKEKDADGKPVVSNVNEGIRISAIFRELERISKVAPPAVSFLLTQALDIGRQVISSRIQKLRPPKKAALQNFHFSNQKSESLNLEPAMSNPHSYSVTVPLTISVSIGDPSNLNVPSLDTVSSQSPNLTEKLLGRKAEKLQVDSNYSTRLGYQAEFIADTKIPLPKLTGKTLQEVAALRATEERASEGELKYEHFSIKMNRSKRMAIFTATNIDGEQYLRVDRATGEVQGGAEGEVWFKDPRISESVYLDQSFYSQWSTYFDRGHLTRRTDPTWGTPEEAKRANADTFHFTNCTPQHFRFNQSARYWQGVERYVLENGVLAATSKSRLCVIQGPIFNEDIDRTADYDGGDSVQIPSSFFKLVVWKTKSGLRAVGLVVDQSELLDESRQNLGQPTALASVDVKQFRVAIKDIETRTGLDFGEAVRKADTIGSSLQPGVGRAESLNGVLISDFSDIVL